MIREKWYEWKNWREMVHTTWNPKDPGVIRIHLIPPRFKWFHVVPSVAILNGNQIIPLRGRLNVGRRLSGNDRDCLLKYEKDLSLSR